MGGGAADAMRCGRLWCVPLSRVVGQALRARRSSRELCSRSWTAELVRWAEFILPGGIPMGAPSVLLAASKLERSSAIKRCPRGTQPVLHNSTEESAAIRKSDPPCKREAASLQ